MKVAVLQSNYIPWRGYFDLIRDVDCFVFYDDVQFTKNDWRNRNYIQGPQGPRWLSIPTGKDISQLICEVRVDKDPSWRNKHWQILQQSYRSAKYFRQYQDFFAEVYAREWTHLSELNHYLIQKIAADFLGIQTKFLDSRQFSLQGKNQFRLLDLLSQMRATHYLSGPAAKDYIQAEEFQKRDITLSYKEYPQYPEYPQPYQPYQPRLSIVDLLFHTGPRAKEYIWGTP